MILIDVYFFDQIIHADDFFQRHNFEKIKFQNCLKNRKIKMRIKKRTECVLRFVNKQNQIIDRIIEWNSQCIVLFIFWYFNRIRFKIKFECVNINIKLCYFFKKTIIFWTNSTMFEWFVIIKIRIWQKKFRFVSFLMKKFCR